jgi:hypothetical protein
MPKIEEMSLLQQKALEVSTMGEILGPLIALQ